MSDKILNMDSLIGDMPLTLKLGKYQRSLMMHGLTKGDSKQKVGLEIMNALYSLKVSQDFSWRHINYAKFIADPLGTKAKERELELLRMKKIDDYDKAIRLYPEAEEEEEDKIQEILSRGKNELQ